MTPKSREHDHLRRMAVQIASQLPDNTAEAMIVIDHLRELVLFMEGGGDGVSSNVTAFPASVSSR